MLTPPPDELAIRRLASVRGMVVLAVPLILGMAATSVMQFTDRWFLSQLGPEALAASMPASILAYVGQCLFSVAAAYVSTFAAQHFGADERRECGRSVWPALWIALAAGLINAAATPFLPGIFAITRADPAVQADMVTLGGWFCACACPATVIAAIGGFFAGTGRTAVVLALNGCLLVVNAGLNAVLIFGLLGCPALGVVGSGIATCIASWCIALVAVGLLLSPGNRAQFGTWSRPLWHGPRILRFVGFAFPQALRTFLEVASWTWFVFAIGRLGTESLAANNIVLNWNMLTYLPMVGLGQAIGVVVGQALGAGRPDVARSAAHRGVVLELGYALVVGIAIVSASTWIIAPFLTGDGPGSQGSHDRVVVIARQLLVVAALWGVGDAINIAYSGALSGAGDTRWQMIAALIASVTLMVLPMMVVVGVPAQTWREHGLEPVVVAWTVTLVFVTGTSALMAWRFYRGPWQRMSVRG